jgi:hypothetical protein
MALQPYERFNAITDWRKDNYNQNLLYGVLEWARWSMLQIGGFVNVTASQVDGVYGGNMSQLRPVVTPNYTNGRVWESIRGDWVWESGVEYSTIPVRHSGVYVNSVFYNSNTVGTYAHHADYPLGRIVFDSAISTSATVKTDYAHRTPTIVTSDTPWFDELMYGSFDVHRDDWLIAASGSHSQLAQARRNMPCVGLELVDRIGFAPYQLGGGQYIFQGLLYYIFAENKTDRNQLVDLFTQQNDITIWIPDRGLMKESGNFPYNIDYEGKLIDSPIQYPQLIAPTGDDGFRWATVSFSDTSSQMMETVNSWLYRAVVKTNCTTIFENI